MILDPTLNTSEPVADIMKTSRAGLQIEHRVATVLVCLACAAILLASSPASSQQGGSRLVYPVDLVASDGALTVADFKAHALLRVDFDGTVTTIARGEGLPRTPLYGIRAVVEAPDGNGWLVADPGTFGIYRISPDGEISVITTEVDIPQGLVAFDDQSVLVSDLRGGIGAVLRVTLDGVVTVFAEIGSPKGIIADGDDGFLLVSHGQRALLHLSRNGTVRTIVSGSPLDYPHDLLRWDDDTVIVSDGYAHALFKVTRGGEISVLAQGAPLISPQGLARGPDGNLLVVDPQAGAVFRVSESGEITTIATVGSASTQSLPSAR